MGLFALMFLYVLLREPLDAFWFHRHDIRAVIVDESDTLVATWGKIIPTEDGKGSKFIYADKDFNIRPKMQFQMGRWKILTSIYDIKDSEPRDPRNWNGGKAIVSSTDLNELARYHVFKDLMDALKGEFLDGKASFLILLVGLGIVGIGIYFGIGQKMDKQYNTLYAEVQQLKPTPTPEKPLFPTAVPFR